ncbi:hypothetical protein ACFQ1Q_08080 [Winogradskyella litorisediminis]|uniref:SPW repeat-containing protein n=1 Tax=Winogradskyella litorisediminis TaxID=1156618 RepID=A0ABW3N8C9_9FLAO
MSILKNIKSISWREWSVSLYKISLITPIFIGAWGLIGFFGIILGWIGVLSFEPTVGLPWIANFIYAAILFVNRISIKIKLFLSIIMIVFALFAIGITSIPRDEGGGNYKVYVGFGFAFWILSFICIFMEQLNAYKKSKLSSP